MNKIFSDKFGTAIGLIAVCLLIWAAPAQAAVPGAPVIGTATAGPASATVTFSPPTTGGGAITSYTVTSSPGAITATGTASPITVTGLLNNTTYTFRVTATNASGTGPSSAASNSILTPTVPGAPTIGLATAGNAQALVDCTPPLSDGGDPIVSYTATSTPGNITGTATACPVLVSGLPNNTAYTFKVAATNGVGTGLPSAASNVIAPNPNVPTIGTATAGNMSATVSFTPPTGGGPYTYFTVTANPIPGSATGTTSPITVTGLANGTAYTFTVTATDAQGGTTQPSFPSNSVLPAGPPNTTASPMPAIYTSPVSVTLTATAVAPPAVIYYTTDGTTPTTASTVYTAPIPVSATTTINFFAVDANNIPETVKFGTWTIHTADLTGSILINNGATATASTAVTLTLNASDPAGVATMQFSNDNVTYTAEEPYSITKAWTLTTGDGPKTVYVQFRDAAIPTGYLYPPVAATILYSTVPPVTTASPVTGTYATAPVSVSLATDKPSTTYYTIDGTTPTTASTVYAGPISVTATTTIKYFSVDTAGNVEAVKSGTWTIHTADMVASVAINSGAAYTNNAAVTLTLSSTDPQGVSTMQFSNDGTTYTLEEAYATSKAWTLASGDGVKTVYVRYRDKSLPNGYLYPPVTANITLDTIAPVTTASPITGTYSIAPVNVTLTTNEAATVYYTVDGTAPTTASAKYTAPIAVSVTTTVKYYAVDLAGNAEAVKSGTWTMHVTDMTASMSINSGAAFTNNHAVTLALSASDPQGIVKMQFSNDNVTYTAEEPYATTKSWTLTTGDGLKTVYVRFRDNSLPSGFLYDPVTSTITVDTVPPITTAGPVPGIYAGGSVSVTLSANKPATIYYTIDGSVPSTGSSVYSGPLLLAASTTVKYFAVDLAGNAETVKSGTWIIHSSDMTASMLIDGGAAITNNPAVTLTLNAVDPAGIASMQFSNDGANFTAEEPYKTTKAWVLASGDGPKTVYVKFRDNALPLGFLYSPISAGIILDTTPPVTTASPVPATYASGPVLVTLAADEPATIYFTTNGSTPTNASSVYTAPISLAATATVKYFAVDLAGNAEAVKSGTWIVHTSDMTASVKINGGAAHTNNPAVTLTLSAVDPTGIATMQFSNDNVTYTAEEPYAISKAWTLATGDGAKTVYVRFRDKALPNGVLYDPVSAVITLDTVPPNTTAGPVPGTYSSGLAVALGADEPSTVYYTIDGSVPTSTSLVYANPIPVTATTIINYFAVDLAGNAEVPMTGTWTIHSSDMTAKVKINGGSTSTNNPAVTLTLSASDPQGVATMEFSNDGINYSAEEPYKTSKAWTLTPGDGLKTVYARFRDKALPTGVLYDPVIATITVSTSSPITTSSPVPGIYAGGPLNVTLTADKQATIYYTTDGSTPTTASSVYSKPIAVAKTATISYFAVDVFGNTEMVKSGTWTIHTSDMISSVKINGGAATTDNPAVTLTLSASDPTGVDTMQFSNDGASYTVEEPYVTSKDWTLSSGDGTKTVYVRFRDKALPSGNLYDPVMASITLNTSGTGTGGTGGGGTGGGGTGGNQAPAGSPAAPSGLTATASAVSANPSEVSLKWTDNSDNETGFTIQRAADAKFKKALTAFTIAANATDFTDTTVAEKTTYYYRILASNTAGSSKYSNVAKVVTNAQLPAAPTGLVVTASTKNSITIYWTDNAVNEKGCYVERSDSATGKWKRIATVKSNITTYKNKGLKKNTTYWYRVQAYISKGVSAYSDAVSGATTQ